MKKCKNSSKEKKGKLHFIFGLGCLTFPTCILKSDTLLPEFLTLPIKLHNPPYHTSLLKNKVKFHSFSFFLLSPSSNQLPLMSGFGWEWFRLFEGVAVGSIVAGHGFMGLIGCLGLGFLWWFGWVSCGLRWWW